MDKAQAISKAEHYTIRELHALVVSGRIRLPEFQRSFRWEAKDVRALFDSLLRGFPVGSLLLWKRPAPAGRLRIGVLDVEAPEVPDALWVVDGQQRITSLVNAVDPKGVKDRRFALGYSLTEGTVVPLRDPEDLVVPLPSLFDLGKALAWLNEHPEAGKEAARLQEAVARLSNAEIPATTMEDADEPVLREIFDRINNRGRRLNAAEVFDALHGGPGKGLTIEGIRASIASQTSFGLLPDVVVVQALLVRRHTDITRDIHGEFSDSRRRVSDFPSESREEAYLATERALLEAVRFLQEEVGVPHWTFLPFRFQLLVLTRFFALFPGPYDRNLDLLARWFWRTSVAADELGISGSQTDLRDMAKCVVVGEESSSVQRLLASARLSGDPTPPDLSTFRATRSDSKVVLIAMWNREPVDLQTGEPMTVETLADILEGESTPSAVLSDLVPVTTLGEGAPAAANRIVSGLDRRTVMEYLANGVRDLGSLLLTEEIVTCLQDNEHERAIALRAQLLDTYLRDFVTVRTAYQFEDSPPLEDLLRAVSTSPGEKSAP